jgi:hypothetical protein
MARLCRTDLVQRAVCGLLVDAGGLAGAVADGLVAVVDLAGARKGVPVSGGRDEPPATNPGVAMQVILRGAIAYVVVWPLLSFSAALRMAAFR